LAWILLDDPVISLLFSLILLGKAEKSRKSKFAVFLMCISLAIECYLVWILYITETEISLKVFEVIESEKVSKVSWCLHSTR